MATREGRCPQQPLYYREILYSQRTIGSLLESTLHGIVSAEGSGPPGAADLGAGKKVGSVPFLIFLIRVKIVRCYGIGTEL